MLTALMYAEPDSARQKRGPKQRMRNCQDIRTDTSDEAVAQLAATEVQDSSYTDHRYLVLCWYVVKPNHYTDRSCRVLIARSRFFYTTIRTSQLS